MEVNPTADSKYAVSTQSTRVYEKDVWLGKGKVVTYVR